MYTEPLSSSRPVRCIWTAASNLRWGLLAGEPAICLRHLMAPVCSSSANRSYVGVAVEVCESSPGGPESIPLTYSVPVLGSYTGALVTPMYGRTTGVCAQFSVAAAQGEPSCLDQFTAPVSRLML